MTNVTGQTGSGVHAASTKRRPAHWAVPAAVVIALATRLPGLSRPGVLVFDEQYWVTGAVDLIQWGSTHGQFRHPPLGQWIISSGIALFGLTPFGWRVAPLVLGVATVGLVAASAGRLGRSQLLGFGAGVCCALDGVMFTTGRTAMLDVSAGFFVSLTVWLLIVVETRSHASRRWVRGMQVIVLITCGLSTGVKWYGLATLPVVVALMLNRDRSIESGRRRAKAMIATVALGVFIPIGSYLAVWAPQQFGPDPWSATTFVETHVDVARYHLDLRPDNTSAAPGWTWFTMTHPTIFYAENCATPAARHADGPCHGAPVDSGAVILVFQNPLVWLICLGALLGLVVRAIRAPNRWVILLLGVPALQWLPWLVGGRAAYTFYLTTIIPTLLVAAAWLIGPSRARRLARPIIVTLVLVSVLFVFFHPVWTGQALRNSTLATRLWWWHLPG